MCLSSLSKNGHGLPKLIFARQRAVVNPFVAAILALSHRWLLPPAQAALMFRPMSAAMSSRFVSATKRDEEHAREVAAEPKTTGPQILQGVFALELFYMSFFSACTPISLPIVNRFHGLRASQSCES
jgi:hypothetical protein